MVHFLCLFEHVAYAARADANEHFNEFRPRNCEERHVCFTGDRARQQGFTSSRRTDSNDPFRNAPAEPLKLLRIAKKFNDFFQFL